MGKKKAKQEEPLMVVVDQAVLMDQMTQEARRLRSLADSVRARSRGPDLEEYIRRGRGPAYQRDREEWMKCVHAAYAFEEAASRLEQALASPTLRG